MTIDTSPAALRKLARTLARKDCSLNSVELAFDTLLAIAAEKEAQAEADAMDALADVPLPEPNPASAAYPGLTHRQARQYAEAYANAKVAAERERRQMHADNKTGTE